MELAVAEPRCLLTELPAIEQATVSIAANLGLTSEALTRVDVGALSDSAELMCGLADQWGA